MTAKAEVIPFVPSEQAAPQPQPENRYTIRAAHNRTRGVRTFYVASSTRAGHEYAVQHVRRSGQCRWHCSCPDYFYRRFPRRRLCKHARLVRQLVQMAHGVGRLSRFIARMKGGAA